MADRKRAELHDTVKDVCEGLEECGFGGLLEAPVLKMFTDLHKLNDTENVSKVIAALEGAATRMIAGKTSPSFPELMVVSQLLADVEGPAAPPEGADSPLDTEFKSLAANLRLALCGALLQFARPGSDEAKGGIELAAGMLMLLHDKVTDDRFLTFAVEHALLRLVSRNKAAVIMLRDRTWALGPLNSQIEALKDYGPDNADMGDVGEEEVLDEEEDTDESEGEADEEGDEVEDGGDEEEDE